MRRKIFLGSFLVFGGLAAATPLRAAENTEPLQPTFSSIKSGIIDKRCAICHQSGGEASQLPFLEYKDVVDPQGRIVIPGNPDESGLILYTSLPDSNRNRMPPPSTGPRLKPDEIAVMRTWISQGALEN